MSALLPSWEAGLQIVGSEGRMKGKQTLILSLLVRFPHPDPNKDFALENVPLKGLYSS